VLNVELGGQPNDLGGQWVAPYQTEVHALLADLGLELFQAHREGDNVYDE
jgi:putrescine oxidase